MFHTILVLLLLTFVFTKCNSLPPLPPPRVPSLDDDNIIWQAVLVNPAKIRVSDIGSDMVEDLDFSAGSVVEMSLGFGHLLAATHNQVSSPRRVLSLACASRL